MTKAANLFWLSVVALAFQGPALAQQAQQPDPQSDGLTIRNNFGPALSANNPGQPRSFTNARTGSYGPITPGPYYTAAGQSCRSYVLIFVHDGGQYTQNGDACLGTDGAWHTQEGSKVTRGAITLASRQVPDPNVAQGVPNGAPATQQPVPGQIRGGTPPPAQQQATNRPPQQNVPSSLPATQNNPAPPPRNTTPPPAPPSKPPPLAVSLSADERKALEDTMRRLGLPVGPVDPNFDERSQEAARAFWRDQNEAGDPAINREFLARVQVKLSENPSLGGVMPVIITSGEALGRMPAPSEFQ